MTTLTLVAIALPSALFWPTLSNGRLPEPTGPVLEVRELQSGLRAARKVSQEEIVDMPHLGKVHVNV